MSCCNGTSPTQAQKDQYLAHTMSNRAFQFCLNSQISQAARLLAAAELLFSEHDHGDCDPFNNDAGWMFFTAYGLLYTKDSPPNYDNALVHFRKALEIAELVHGKEHEQAAVARGNLAEILFEAGKTVEAETNYLSALAVLNQPPTHVEEGFTQKRVNDILLNFLPVYAKVLRALGKESEAVAVDDQIKTLATLTSNEEGATATAEADVNK